jgi:outer membrane immunogenic protein
MGYSFARFSATARGRLGYAFGPWMLYATGGAAWVNYKLSASGFGVTVSDNATKAAWTLGGGVEWMFMPKWSVKAEYLYLDTGTTTVTLFGVPISGRAKDSIARLGVNYHF